MKTMDEANREDMRTERKCREAAALLEELARTHPRCGSRAKELERTATELRKVAEMCVGAWN